MAVATWGQPGAKVATHRPVLCITIAMSMGSLLSQLNVPLMNHCAQLPCQILGPQFAIDGSLRVYA